MSIFNDKTLKGVADIAAKIMQQEATHPKSEKEKDLAALAHPKDKITHKDVLVGRGVLKKEETEQLDEISLSKASAAYSARQGREEGDGDHAQKAKKTLSYIGKKYGAKGVARAWDKATADHGLGSNYSNKEDEQSKKIAMKTYGVKKEEVENLDEVFDKNDPVGSKKKTTMGTATKTATGVRHERDATKGADYGSTNWDYEEREMKRITKPASRKLGARQNYVRSTRVNESFTEMIAAYQEEGLKSLTKLTQIDEEPDNEQFTKEFEDQKASMEGKKKQPAVAAPATQGVKQMPEEIEVIDANEINGVTIDTIEERTLTEPETKKKEEVVKSMKKKLPGFKERYGDRAKSVLYATATKIAKEKA